MRKLEYKAEMEIKEVLGVLFGYRKYFHNESDFQLALYREISATIDPEKVYLECRNRDNEKDERGKNEEDIQYDIAIGEENSPGIAIELKYGTKKDKHEKVEACGKKEVFRFKDSGIDRYYFWKDVHRLEKFVSGKTGRIGYVVCLTNEKQIWKRYKKPNKTKDYLYVNFRMDEDYTMNAGKAVWDKEDPEYLPLEFKNSYNLKGCWHEIGENQKFRYLLLKIPPV